MVGSTRKTVLDHHNNLMGNNENESENSSVGIACSICLDLVLDNGARSRAKLPCGHEFHLDCIGSAFNMKGAMQCPNCRKIEKGQWLYANGSARPLHELSTDDWIPDEDFHDLSYSELQYGVHWCPSPFNDLAGIGSFEEVESPSTTYHDMRGNQSIYAETSSVSSIANSYVAYIGPVPSTSSTPNDNIVDPNFHHHWNGITGHSDVLDRRAIPAINVQFRSWGHHSPPFASSSIQLSGASAPSATSRSSNLEARTRSASFAHPIFFRSGSGPTAPNSFGSSIAPRHPSGSTHLTGRIHVSHASRQRLISTNSPAMAMPIIHGTRRFDGAMPLPTQQDHSGGFIFIPSNLPGLNFHAWERDQTPPLYHFHQQTQGSGSNG